VRRAVIAGVAALAVAAPAVGTTANAAGATLSRPGHVSRWAFVETATVARVSPSTSAKTVGRLGLKTEDRTSELVLALQDKTDSLGRDWVRVRLPERPNGKTGWVRRETLGDYNIVHTWLKIDRAAFTATLVRDGKVVFTAPVGVGEAGTETPPGEFYIRDRLVGFKPNTIYGAMAFGTSAYSPTLTEWPRGGVVGIHGTNQPDLIPGRISHGCVRMYNADILTLDRLMPVGTPVTIS
jgi:hypothetical protein